MPPHRNTKTIRTSFENTVEETIGHTRRHSNEEPNPAELESKEGTAAVNLGKCATELFRLEYSDQKQVSCQSSCKFPSSSCVKETESIKLPRCNLVGACDGQIDAGSTSN